MLKKCDRICGNMQHIWEVLHMRHNFRICDSENDTICGKICDMHVLAKYAIAYAIAYSHITNIPIFLGLSCDMSKVRSPNCIRQTQDLPHNCKISSSERRCTCSVN